MARRKRVGLVLGSGSARGWAHIGVIRALGELGVRPDLICGTSIGALVGAVFAAGQLDAFEEWIRTLDRKQTFRLMDPAWHGGLLAGDKLFNVLNERFNFGEFEQLSTPFAAVATDLATGKEVWLRKGKVAAAVRASLAMPGLFRPVWHEDRFLIDGAILNPVPVSVAHVMGADSVIAVDLDFDVDRGGYGLEEAPATPSWWSRIRAGGKAPAQGARTPRPPAMISVVSAAIHVMQVRIARSRLAGDPADVLITPRLGTLGLLDYHRGAEAIEAGRNAVFSMQALLREVLAR